MALESLRDIIISLQVNMCLNALLIRDWLLNWGLGSCLVTSYSLYDMKLIFKLRWNIFLLQHNLVLQGKAKGEKNWQWFVAISAQDKNSWEQSKIRSTFTAVQIPPGLNKTGNEVAENWAAWTKPQKEKCNAETARSGISDGNSGWREAWEVCMISICQLSGSRECGSRRISHVMTMPWAKRSPYHILHHTDPTGWVASPVFPGLTGEVALMRTVTSELWGLPW